MPKIACVMQDGPKDCGVCCLLMIVRNYGGNISREKLRELTNTTQHGVNAYDLLEGARKIGFQGRGVKGDLFKLDNYMLPCIAHIIVDEKYQHFVVIDEINFKRKVLVILDPAKGRRKLSFLEFEKLSTKNYLYLKPKTKLPVFESTRFIREIFLFFFKKNKKIMCIIFLISFFYTFLSMIIAFHFKFLMIYVFPYSSKKNAWLISLFISFLVLFQLFFQLIRKRLLNVLDYSISKMLMNAIFEQIVTLPYPYYKNRTTGEVISRINEIDEVKNFVIQLIGFVFFDLFYVICIFLMLYNLSNALAIIALTLVMLSFIILFFFRSIMKQYSKKLHLDHSKMEHTLIEILGGVETVKGMHLEEWSIDKLKHTFFYLNQRKKLIKFIISWLEYLKEHILNFGLIIILLKGSFLIIEGKLSLSNFIIFYNFYFYFVSSSQGIIDFFFTLTPINELVKKLDDLFDVKKEKFLIDWNRTVKNLKGDIVYENVTYCYQSNKLLLKNVFLSIKPKEKIVLYGSSGSGKSTLVKLLLRYYETIEGVIYLDSINIKNYALEDIRKHITYVSQKETLFTDTIYNNIALGKDVDYELFLKVCRITKVDEIVRDQIMGYDQLLEEDGFNLSGGERQRIILARALLRNSSIYIFDEAFSQIDVAKEREILKEVFFYLKDSSVIVISHRYQNQDLFNRMFLLEEGKLVEGVYEC